MKKKKKSFFSISLWPKTHLTIEENDVKDFLDDICNRQFAVRDAATRAFPKLLSEIHRNSIPFVLSDLFEIYTKNNKVKSMR